MTDVNRSVDGRIEGRYGAFESDDGSVVVYDRDEPDAWIESTYSVGVGAEQSPELAE
jgi:hypothetical protein